MELGSITYQTKKRTKHHQRRFAVKLFHIYPDSKVMRSISFCIISMNQEIILVSFEYFLLFYTIKLTTNTYLFYVVYYQLTIQNEKNKQILNIFFLILLVVKVILPSITQVISLLKKNSYTLHSSILNNCVTLV